MILISLLIILNDIKKYIIIQKYSRLILYTGLIQKCLIDLECCKQDNLQIIIQFYTTVDHYLMQTRQFFILPLDNPLNIQHARHVQLRPCIQLPNTLYQPSITIVYCHYLTFLLLFLSHLITIISCIISALKKYCNTFLIFRIRYCNKITIVKIMKESNNQI